jgi:hypothetical protein
MANNMVKEFSLHLKVPRDRAFGMKEKESNGWTKI